MAYTFTNTDIPLYQVTPSENPIWYAAEGVPTGDTQSFGYTYIQSVGGVYDFKHNDYITFVDNWGNTINFSWVTTSNFVTAFSNNSRYVIGGNDPTAYTIYLNSFITAFNNSVLSAHFNAVLDTSVSPPRIKINNLVPGLAGSVLALGGTFPTGAGSIYETGVVFGDYEYEPQQLFQSPYTIARIQTNQEEPFPSLNDKSNKETVGELVKAFVGGDTIYFDPSHTLKNIVETVLPRLDTGFLQPNQLKRYWIEYGTGGYYGINSNTDFVPTDQTDIRWILNAAQALEYDPDLTPYWRNALNPCEGDIVKCLTNSPNRNISRTPVVFSKNPLLINQKWFLSFICEVPDLVNIHYVARYDTGLTLSGVVPVLDALGAPIVSEIGVMTIDVSPSYLGFQSLPDGIVDYDVQIFIGPNPYTEIRKYYVINNCLPSRTQIMFLNRLGGWDTYYFIGDNNTKDSRKAQDFNKTRPTTIKPYNRGSAQFNINYTRGLSLSSGQLNSSEFIWLEELLGSNDVYIVNRMGEFEAVTITNFNRDFSSREQLYTIDVTIEKSLPTNNVNNTGVSGTMPYIPPFIP